MLCCVCVYVVLCVLCVVPSQIHGGEFGVGTETLRLAVTLFVDYHVTVATHVALLAHETQ